MARERRARYPVSSRSGARVMAGLPSSSARNRPWTTIGATTRPPAGWGIGTFLSSVRARLISGLIFSLPIVITFWIIYWIFMTSNGSCSTRLPAWSTGFTPGCGIIPLSDRPAQMVVQHWLTSPGDPAGAGNPVHDGLDLPLVGLPHARMVLAACTDRRHDLPGGAQRGRVAGEPVPGGRRVQASGPGRVPPSRARDRWAS